MLRDRAPTGVFFTPVSSLAEWAVKDSNLRRLLPTDLQSVPFGHLGNCPEPYQPFHALVAWSHPLGLGPTDEQINGKVPVNDPSRRWELNP